jgi:hypothetical protein
MKKFTESNTKNSDAKLKRLKLMKTLEKMEKNAKLMKVKVDSTKIIRKYRDAR